MKPEIVNSYRRLLKSVSDKVNRIDNTEFQIGGLTEKATGMVVIYERIVDLPEEEVWQMAKSSGASLEKRVYTMREVDDLLGKIVTTRDLGLESVSVRGRLRALVAGLPGDDPTDF